MNYALFNYYYEKGNSEMAIRIVYLILAFTLVVNLVLLGVSGVTGVNLYEKYGKQILKFFVGFGLLVIAIYVTLAIIGLT